MRIFHDQNVFDAAKERIAHIYDRFDNVVVSFSGGKDSIVLLMLTIEVAREKGKLPVETVFLDQEAEWQVVIDYIRRVGEMPEVDLRWYQIPFKITSSHSKDQLYMYCWDPELNDETWMRPKEPGSIQENDLWVGKGKRRRKIDTLFKEVLTGIHKLHYGPNTCFLGGVRAEESPGRMLGLTRYPVFDGLTYGKKVGGKKSKDHMAVMYPIYDWSYKDVWHAIHKEQWEYCRLYDIQYAYGTPVLRMRVSSLCHENAVRTLSELHEFERPTWEKLLTRLKGAATAKEMGLMTFPKELPYMFKDWREYRDYLVDNLLEEPGRSKVQQKFASVDKKYVDSNLVDDGYVLGIMQICITTVLRNDLYYVGLDNYLSSITFGAHLRPGGQYSAGTALMSSHIERKVVNE